MLMPLNKIIGLKTKKIGVGGEIRFYNFGYNDITIIKLKGKKSNNNTNRLLKF
jgi:hypothetical protein